MTQAERMYDRQLEPAERTPPLAACPKCGKKYDPEQEEYGYCASCERAYLQNENALKGFAELAGDDFYCRFWIGMDLKWETPSAELRDLCRENFCALWQNLRTKKDCVIALRDFADARKSEFFEFVREYIG